MPDVELYLNMDVQYGTTIDKSLLLELCAPTHWLEAILATSTDNPREQDVLHADVEREGPPLKVMSSCSQKSKMS